MYSAVHYMSRKKEFPTRSLIKETQEQCVNLYRAWQTGSVQQRQELAFALYPEDLYYSAEVRYFEPRNTLFLNAWQAMIDEVVENRLIGVPDGI